MMFLKSCTFLFFVVAVCKAGEYGKEVKETLECLPCPENMYQPQEGQFECLPCPRNHITHMEGATTLEQCDLGKIQASLLLNSQSVSMFKLSSI
jgi:hypothetical protein